MIPPRKKSKIVAFKAPKKDPNKQFYWHLSTSEELGASVVRFIPKVRGEHRNDDEPLISRFCVAKTPGGCFVALPYEDNSPQYFLYRSSHKIITHRPYNVPDSRVTGERWKLSRCNMTLIREFTPDEVAEIYDIFKRAARYRECSIYDIGHARLSILEAQKVSKYRINTFLKERYNITHVD